MSPLDSLVYFLTPSLSCFHGCQTMTLLPNFSSLAFLRVTCLIRPVNIVTQPSRVTPRASRSHTMYDHPLPVVSSIQWSSCNSFYDFYDVDDSFHPGSALNLDECGNCSRTRFEADENSRPQVGSETSSEYNLDWPAVIPFPHQLYPSIIKRSS
jgi:hypothetical protein